MSCMTQNGTNKQIDVKDIFACKVVVDMINEKDDHKRKYFEKCTQRDDWPNQKKNNRQR